MPCADYNVNSSTSLKKTQEFFLVKISHKNNIREARLI